MQPSNLIIGSFDQLKGTKPLHRFNPMTKKKDGDIYAYMCKHCGSIWEVGKMPVHEPICRNFQLPA